MASLIHFAHAIIPILISSLYIHFIFFLSYSITVSIIISVIFIFLFFSYFITIYTLFHSKPGYITYNSTVNKMGVQSICEYKRNQQRKAQILNQLNKNLTCQKIKQLQNQYTQLYMQYSFCDTCQIVKLPRSYHCHKCDKCVMRREKHSELIGGCIGQKNMKEFMQYLFVTIFLLAYMACTLLFIVVCQHNELQKIDNTALVFFSILEMTLGTCIALFIKQFIISYFNAVQNLTETQRQIEILNSKNNPFSKIDYYHTLFKGFCDYLRIGGGPNPSYWIQLQEQN